MIYDDIVLLLRYRKNYVFLPLTFAFFFEGFFSSPLVSVTQTKEECKEHQTKLK